MASSQASANILSASVAFCTRTLLYRMKAAIHAQGAEPEAMSAAQFNTLLKTDYAKWKGIVEASGAKIE